ncbi:MAG TPA: hypothetical protein VKY89_19250 [Thermoanaerobaculia bacterium]|jgi:hypothetical protein|nr:hypothetical protein [Thermoanaerobaculia bacterium]
MAKKDGEDLKPAPRRRSHGRKGKAEPYGDSGSGPAPGIDSCVAEPDAAYARGETYRSLIVERDSSRGSSSPMSGPLDYARILQSTPAGTRILEILNSVFPTQQAMLLWLNHPHEDLGGKTPLEVVAMGYPGAVEGMLEAALVGLPS